MHLPGSVLGFTFTPERAWAANPATMSFRDTAVHFGVLALVPAMVAALLTTQALNAVPGAGISPLAAESPFGLALSLFSGGGMVPVTPVAEAATASTAAVTAGLTYAATWLAAMLGALVLRLVMPLFDVRVTFRDMLRIAAYSATPLLLGSATLLHASLAPVVALAAMQSFYVAWLGLPCVSALHRDDAGVALALAVLAGLIGSQFLGYGLGALHSALFMH